MALVTQYLMDDAPASGVAVDSIGAHDGTTEGDADFTGCSLQVSGNANSTFRSSAHATLAPNAAGSLMAWASWPEALSAIVRDQSGSGGDPGWMLVGRRSGDTILNELIYRVGGGDVLTGVPLSFLSSLLTHYAITWDGAGSSLYINGILVHSGPPKGVQNIDLPWVYGQNGVLSQYWPGEIADLRIYDTRLNSAAIAAIAAEGSPCGVTGPGVSFGWDAYASTAPNGGILATVQNDETPIVGATARGIRIELNGTGSGTFKVNRYSTVATEAVVAEGNIVKCRFPWRDSYDFAFILEKGDFTLAHADEKGGEEFTFGGRGILAYLDRAVMDAVAYTTGLDTSDTWTELWHTNAVPSPAGTAFDPAQSAYMFAISGTTRRIYKIRQSDRAVVGVSPAICPRTAVGLSGDPADATVWWVLEGPWASGSGANTRIHKVRKSDYLVLATFDLGAATQYTAIKADATSLWLSRYDGANTISKRSKATGGSIASYSITYGGNVQLKATGISVNGSLLAYWYEGKKRALIADVSAPTVILSAISTQSISAFGGDWSTEAGQDYFYMDSATVGLIWKYQITAATPHDPVDGIWRLDEGSPGAILWRVVQEAQAAGRPQQPIPDMTYVFTATDDTDGATWTPHDGTLEFDAQITESVLNVALRLLQFGLVEQMSPYLELGAWNASAYGEDRTGGGFAPGVVRFEKGVNIIPELGRQTRERPLHSHMLATGKSGLYARAILADLGYVREGGFRTDLADETALAGQAAAALDDERVKSERIRFAVPIGSDEGAGLYLPFSHYNVGDLVTLHTGAGEHDFTNETFLLYAISLEEGEAGTWQTAVIELGSATLPDKVDVPSGGITTGGGGGTGGGTIVTGSTTITVEGIDDTGTTVTTGIGSKLRIAGAQVYQEAVGVIRIVIAGANRLLGLDDVDAADIADGQGLAWDAASGMFVPVTLAAAPGGQTPTYIGPGETFTVDTNRQVLFAMTIDNEGTLEVDGFLIEVD